MEQLDQELQRLENQVQVTPEQTLPVNGDTADLQMAVKGGNIRQVPSEELKQVLRYVMMKVGLRAQNWPSEAEKAVLLNHVWKEYGGHTTAEIRLAFDMAISRKLDLEEKEIPCYENFSCLYFSTVMTAYRKWAVEEYKQTKTAPALPAAVEDTSDVAMRDWMGEIKGRVKAGKQPMTFMPLSLYDWMDKKGLITASREEKAGYLVKAAEYRQGQLNQDAENDPSPYRWKKFHDFMKMKGAGEISGEEIEQVKNLAKKLLMFDILSA